MQTHYFSYMIYLAVVSLYSFCLLVFGLFGLHRVWLLWLYFQQRTKNSLIQVQPLQTWPIVTVQLPIYNEQYVVTRLIEAVCQIDYPLDCLEIQILDDSSDKTTQIINQLVIQKQLQGFDIKAVKRSIRKGFKAGALHDGLGKCRGEFILIFDADFIPPSDVLQNAIPYFRNPQVGMVQFPWDHINRNYSFLTWVQAILLDGHFNIEHFARSRSGRFFNFNGTAGVWRKQCIFDAGGWQEDTLTEDLDLSYRAQLQGWQFIYVPNFRIPAELPVELNAFKSQQYRWAKGGVQTAIKLLPKLLKSSAPLKVKIEAIFHLTANVTYLFMPFFILALPILVVCTACLPNYIHFITFTAAFLSIIAFYMTAQASYFKQNIWKSMAAIPMVMAIAIGLCINNCRAILGALFSRQTNFFRTPKYNIASKQDRWQHRKNYRVKISAYFFIELFFLGYLVWVGILSILHGAYHLMPFLAIFIFGFLYFVVLTLKQFYIK